MALSRVKTWISGEVLSSSDLNSEFNNILTNALSLISPLTGNLAAGGNKITGLAAGTTAGDALRYEQVVGVYALLSELPEGFTTGDVKITIKTTADSGWVLMDDTTIGNGASGATGRANADTEDLFTLLWTNTANADCAVSGGRGGSAAADYAANKTIALPKTLGRALATYGSGSGLTARALAAVTGVETHALSAGELASHTHTGPSHTHTGTTASNGAHTHDIDNITANTVLNGAVTGVYSNTAGTLTTTSNGAHTHTFTSDAGGTGNTGSAGSGTAHQNMQPSVFLNVMIKL